MDDLSKLTDHELLSTCVTLTNALTDIRNSLDRLRYELISRLMERQATEFTSDNWTAKLVTETRRYDMTKLIASLQELIPPEDWAKAYIPAHQETVDVPARLHMTKVNSWREYGRDVQDAITSATLPDTPQILMIVPTKTRR